MNHLPLTATQRKVARMAVGLAPEDTTTLQAANTGRMRRDADYLPRWIEHEMAMDRRDAELYARDVITLDLV